jgi:hypothetical protein
MLGYDRADDACRNVVPFALFWGQMDSIKCACSLLEADGALTGMHYDSPGQPRHAHARTCTTHRHKHLRISLCFTFGRCADQLAFGKSDCS